MRFYVKIISMLLLAAFCASAQSSGGWVELHSTLGLYFNHRIVELPNGNVLLSSERKFDSSYTDIYDFQTRSWRHTTPVNINRNDHLLFTLKTGKVLAIGGYDWAADYIQSCELFDPVTETWTLTDSLNYQFSWPAAVELKNGNILLAGGYKRPTTGISELVNTAEIYDIQTGKWKPAAPMIIARTNHTLTLLQDGRVLASGGTNTFLRSLNSCEIYDPEADTWTAAASMNNIRENHPAVLLGNGNVFVCSGNTAEVYDVDENRWISTGNLLAERIAPAAYYSKKLGKIIILGGGPPESWEVYDALKLKPVYKRNFPANQTMVSLQLSNENIFVAGGKIYVMPDWGMPYMMPTKRSWLFDLLTGLDDDELIDINSFELEQNYPNPFNPSAVIRYSLPDEAKVRLTVYNSLGETVRILADGVQSTGTYEVTFDGTGLSSGIYFYELTAASAFRLQKKMLLLK